MDLSRFLFVLQFIVGRRLLQREASWLSCAFNYCSSSRVPLAVIIESVVAIISSTINHLKFVSSAAMRLDRQDFRFSFA